MRFIRSTRSRGAGFFTLLLTSTTVVALAGTATRAAELGSDEVTFNKLIRPILSDRCFTCHGPDSANRKADLRLDRQASAFGPLPKDADRRAFVPGHPDQSEAFRRIMSSDPDEVMPPAKSKLKLNDQEKALIGKWIEQGAKWQEHWAFIRPERPAAPTVKDAAWPRNDIDRLVLAPLEAIGLHPSPEADRATLIRRVSLDLTGIPPTPREVDDFLADASPNAYEKLVDRLLASPRYGEQMAERWLDAARYADSHGYQSDPERHMWQWRDWVINAYNANMPFDEFTVEQLAGDLLPNPTVQQRIATAFNRNHRINDEGGIIAEEWRIEGVLDRVETTSEVWLGLTMGCCRCHDHKFDPISQKEYYQFSGFFNSVNEVGVGDTQATDRGINVPPILKLPSPEQQSQMADLNGRIARANDRLKALDDAAAELTDAWATTATGGVLYPDNLVAAFPLDENVEGRDAAGRAVPAFYEQASSARRAAGPLGGALEFDGTGSAVSLGDAVAFDHADAFSYGCRAYVRGTGGTLLSKMDPEPAYRGFDLRIENGHVEVHLIHHWEDDAIKVVTQGTVPSDRWIQVIVTYDGSGKADGVRVYVDGENQNTNHERDHLTGTLKTPTPLLIGKRVRSDPFRGMIQDVEFYGRALQPEEVRQLAARPQVQQILQLSPERRSTHQWRVLEAYYRGCAPEFSREHAEVATATQTLAAIDKQVPDIMVMEELPKPRDTYVLVRGQYDKHGDKVEPGLPAVLPPMPPGQPINRLGLARWIVDPSNPLTARVQANRLWEKLFGVGLVKTSENLGTQAEAPANPELLDWLATELLRDHWDLKAFQKSIVMSATYRQSSNVTPEMIERDPENRLLARGPRFRLPAETIRDQALAISGLLVERIGGPSARPYEPANLWEGNLFGNLAQYVTDKGDGLYRRSVYTFLKRTAAPPNLSVFDMPSREYCVLKRSRTDTPLQALDLMNDPTYVEASRVLAQHMMIDGGSTPADRIGYAFRRALCRNPGEREMKIMLAGLDRQLERYRADPAAAAKFIAVGESPRDPKLDPGELAAYTMTASVILNLDEVINKD